MNPKSRYFVRTRGSFGTDIDAVDMGLLGMSAITLASAGGDYSNTKRAAGIDKDCVARERLCRGVISVKVGAGGDARRSIT